MLADGEGTGNPLVFSARDLIEEEEDE